MKVGVSLPQFVDDPAPALDAAREAERLGYASVCVFDHLQPLGGPPTRPILEAFTLLTALAAATERVRLLPLVVRASLRPPATLGHMTASLARIAEGRLVMALGAGDRLSAHEDRSIGLPDDTQPQRRARLVAAIEAVCAMAPDVPVWVGGAGPATRRLAGELADGWNVWDASVDDVAEGVADVRAAAGDRPDPYVTWGGPVRDDDWPAHIARLGALAALGVAECLLAFPGPDGARRRRDFAREVLPSL